MVSGGPLPLPWQEFMEPGLRDFGDASEDVSEPGLGVDVVEARGHDEGIHYRGPVRPACGSHPWLAEVLARINDHAIHRLDEFFAVELVRRAGAS
jgi:hypothetical protein